MHGTFEHNSSSKACQRSFNRLNISRARHIQKQNSPIRLAEAGVNPARSRHCDRFAHGPKVRSRRRLPHFRLWARTSSRKSTLPRSGYTCVPRPVRASGREARTFVPSSCDALRTRSAKRSNADNDPDTLRYSSRPILPSSNTVKPAARATAVISICSPCSTVGVAITHETILGRTPYRRRDATITSASCWWSALRQHGKPVS